MRCKICDSKAPFLFTELVLNRHEVKYFQCSHCSFLQTEEPYWLERAYGNGAISALDTGILKRNATLALKTGEIIEKNFSGSNSGFRGLDYGGGEGIFVRMMRDKGFNFFLYDKYATNLYAKFFDLNNRNQKENFDLLTAYEVFEHLSDPLAEIDKMFTYSDVILFSTELIPRNYTRNLQDWWYIVPETGQHIAFYHSKTLKFIARKKGVYLYSNGYNLHILTKDSLKTDPFQNKPENFFQKLISSFSKRKHQSRFSLIQKDFEYVRSRLKKDE